MIKTLTFIYFLYWLDIEHLSIKGAMCAFGVVNSNDFGWYLLDIKILIIYLTSIWLYIEKLDSNSYKYTKKKYII